MQIQLNNLTKDWFPVTDEDDLFITGISASFTGQLIDPSFTEVAGNLVINEIGSGYYSTSFTPNVQGTWSIRVFEPDYFPEGKFGTYQCIDYDNKFDVIDNNIDDILIDSSEIQGKLPVNYIMGSSVTSDKDDEINDIKTKTDNLPLDTATELSTILTDTNEIQGKLPINNIADQTLITVGIDENEIKIDAMQLNVTDILEDTSTTIPNYLSGMSVVDENHFNTLTWQINGVSDQILAIDTGDLDDLLDNTNVIKGLVQHNFEMSGMEYNLMNKMTGSTINIYEDSAMLSGIKSYKVEGIYDDQGRLLRYRSTEQ